MARDPREDDSVFDFLYVDVKRIASFLSQFDQFGHLTALTRTASETTTSGGGLNVHVAKVDASSSAQTTQTRQFDPQWLAPLSFLDQANQRGMIVRELETARIGQLVLVTGDLAMFDLALFKELWNIASIRSAIINSANAASDTVDPSLNRHERRRQGRSPQSEQTSALEAGLEVIKVLPHGMISVIRSNNRDVWSSLREADLVVSPSDLLLSHGASIAGSWTTLGILDALPHDDSDSDHVLSEILAATSLGSLGIVIGQLAPRIRAMLGRPSTAYGVTPLLIFREVSV